MFQQTAKNPSQIDQMDWYFSSGRDDLIVPQYQESQDKYLSQDYLSQWEQGSNGMSMFGELPLIDYSGSNSESSLRGTDDWPEYQLDSSSAETDQMNDNFLNSLLKDDTSLMDSTYHSFGMPSNNLMKDLKYLEVPSYTTPMEGNSLDDKPTCMLSNSQQRKGFLTREAPVSAVETSHDTDEQRDEETSSVEATTLQDLETAMVQLRQETRISFRDALYRLANNSKQQHLHSQVQNGELNPTLSNQEPPRFGERENRESESNAFESTIAHLMFNNLNCGR